MNRKIVFLLLISVSTLFICCDQSPSLQKYFVEKADDSSFSIINISVSDSIFTEKLSREEINALKSIDKISVLFSKAHSDLKEKTLEEIYRIDDIFKQGRYENLITFNLKGSRIDVYLEGDSENIDEGVVWIRAPNYGLGIIRILGNDMDPAMTAILINKIDVRNFEEHFASLFLCLRAFH